MEKALFIPGRFDELNTQLANLERPTLVTALECGGAQKADTWVRMAFGTVLPGHTLEFDFSNQKNNRKHARIIVPFVSHLYWDNLLHDPNGVLYRTKGFQTKERLGTRMLRDTPPCMAHISTSLGLASSESERLKKLKIVIGNTASHEFLTSIAERTGISLEFAQMVLKNGAKK